MISALLLVLAPPANFDSSSTVTRLVSSGFGRCLAEKKPDLARKAVLEDWNGRQMHDQKLILPECLAGGTLYAKAVQLKAGMASALIERDAIDPIAERINAAPPLSYRQPEPPVEVDRKGRPLSKKNREEEQERFRSAIEWIAISQFGECVARQAPSAVPALAKSVVNSPGEMAAFKPFGPHLAGCLPKGVAMELDKPTLRAVLTLAYYRLAIAAGAPTQGAAR